MTRKVLAVLLVLVQACTADVEPENRGDFAVLAQGAEGFAQARPGEPLVFPRDHGAHPAYRIEWWYLTANLQGSDGLTYGAQWTLFRSATRPPGEKPPANPWQDPQVYMAHLAITTPDDHVAFQRYARGGVHDGQARAGATAQPFEAWLDNWVLRSTGEGWLPLQLRAAQKGYAIDLQLDSERPKVLQGEEGFSQKHPDGGGSYYYSQPFLEARGDLAFNGRVVSVSGSAWLDREWSSQFLKVDQLGWDWFALHLESGEKLMLFRLRGVPGSNSGDFQHGVLIEPSGAKRQLDPEKIELMEVAQSTVAGRELPLHWRISLGDLDRELEVRALHPDQWMDVDFAYWEGVVTVGGEGPGSSGVGYLEMTGYSRR